VVVEDLAERSGDVGLGVHAVQLAGADQRGDAGPCFRSIGGAREERILSCERNRTDRVLHPVGVHLEPAIVEEADQPVPAFEAVSDMAGQFVGRGKVLQAGLEPGPQRLDDGSGELLADGPARGGVPAADLLLDGVEGGDARDHLLADRRRRVLAELDEAAPPMGPGPVAYLCRSKCSFKPPSVQKRPDFSIPMLSADAEGYRTR
jgi:hypothetical protein